MSETILATMLGDYEAARRSLEDAVVAGGGDPFLLLELAEVWHRLGNSTQANATLDKAWRQWGRRRPEILLPALAELGRESEARRILADLETRFADGEFVYAAKAFEAYYHLGEYDAALVWLQRAIDDRQFAIFSRLRAGRFEAVHDDPRFEAAMRQLEAMETKAPDREPSV